MSEEAKERNSEGKASAAVATAIAVLTPIGILASKAAEGLSEWPTVALVVFSVGAVVGATVKILSEYIKSRPSKTLALAQASAIRAEVSKATAAKPLEKK